jgi:M6 family metalloprotease-like protein
MSGPRTALAIVACALAVAGAAPAAAAAAVHDACSIGRMADLTEGPTDYSRFVRPAGTVRGVMLFVDFGDAPADEAPADLYQALVPPAAAYFASASFGRMSFEVRPLLAWLRMPRRSSAYGFEDGLTLEEHLAYYRDAIRLADPRISFRGAREVYIVSSRGAALPVSPALVAGLGSGLRADGTRIGFGATFGNDIRTDDESPYLRAPWILEHETGHTFGLPDLYRIPSSGDFHVDVGAWDPMGNLFRGTSYMAWHRRKLGWLSAAQQVCVARPRTRTVTLAPLDRPGGRKLLVVRVDRNRAYSVEVRRPVGTDAGLCGSGVLISLVDARRRTGKSPIVVQRARQAAADVDWDCGATANAAFGSDPGDIRRFRRVRDGVRIEVSDAPATATACGPRCAAAADAGLNLSTVGPHHAATRRRPTSRWESSAA